MTTPSTSYRAVVVAVAVVVVVVVMPGGVGAALWNSTEFDESMNRPYGEPFDLAPRFVEFD